jgi:outer membrane murein-binding lipoprotein Lpp
MGMGRRRVLVAVLVLGVGFAAAGCGSSSKASDTTTTSTTARLTSAELSSRVSSICAAWKTELFARPKLDVVGFDPMNPDPALLPAVGAHFAPSAELAQRTVDQLQALEVAPGNRDDLDALVAALEAEVANIRTQVQAAKDRDVEGFKATADKASTLRDDVKQAAGAFGADGCAFD